MNIWSSKQRESFCDFFLTTGAEINVGDFELSAIFKKEGVFIEFSLNLDTEIKSAYVYTQFTKGNGINDSFFFSADEVGDTVSYSDANKCSFSGEEVNALLVPINEKAPLIKSWLISEGFEPGHVVGISDEGEMNKSAMLGVVSLGDGEFINYTDL